MTGPFGTGGAIEAVVFDFGGVLTHPLRDAVLPLVLAAGYDPDAVVEVFRPMFASPEDGDEPWHQLERGEVTMAEFLDQLDAPVRDVAGALFDPASPHFALAHVRPYDVVDHDAAIAGARATLGLPG